MEAWEMRLFIFCTCSFATLLQNPASPVRHFVISGIVRRALMGLAVGATVMALIMSPWGKQSGGHINPAMTFAFYRLAKLRPRDALFYGVAQFSGATIGVALATFLLREALQWIPYDESGRNSKRIYEFSRGNRQRLSHVVLNDFRLQRPSSDSSAR
jgi:aquaporin Z